MHLPQSQHDSKMKLMKALQKDEYSQMQKRADVNVRSLALLNEERRKMLDLPPLTAIDYNCIERAAVKLKLIVECLTIAKRMSGNALLSRDVILNQLTRQ